MKKITIIWGTEAVKGIDKPEEGYTKKTYEFKNDMLAHAFMMGVDEANGWLEYKKVEDENR